MHVQGFVELQGLQTALSECTAAACAAAACCRWAATALVFPWPALALWYPWTANQCSSGFTRAHHVLLSSPGACKARAGAVYPCKSARSITGVPGGHSLTAGTPLRPAIAPAHRAAAGSARRWLRAAAASAHPSCAIAHPEHPFPALISVQMTTTTKTPPRRCWRRWTRRSRSTYSQPAPP